MKVYVVVGSGWTRVAGVYANKADAEKAAEYEQWCAGCEGSCATFRVEEHELR